MRRAEFDKKTLNLRAGDWDYIESISRPQGIPTSEVVRILVSNFVDRKRQQEAAREPIDLDLNL